MEYSSRDNRECWVVGVSFNFGKCSSMYDIKALYCSKIFEMILEGEMLPFCSYHISARFTENVIIRSIVFISNGQFL